MVPLPPSPSLHQSVRRDNCPLVKNMVQNILNKILIERSVDGAIQCALDPLPPPSAGYLSPRCPQELFRGWAAPLCVPSLDPGSRRGTYPPLFSLDLGKRNPFALARVHGSSRRKPPPPPVISPPPPLLPPGRYAKQIISDLLMNRLDISHLVISKSLSKSGEEYTSKQVPPSPVHPPDPTLPPLPRVPGPRGARGAHEEARPRCAAQSPDPPERGGRPNSRC